MSTCTILQHAWTKHGEDAFRFSILEECAAEMLEVREQFFIDTLKPHYNSITDIRRRYGPEMLANRAASLRARAAQITHCPHGHAYDEKNAYRNKEGTRICRTCNAMRVRAIYAAETPEQREHRRRRVKEDYFVNRSARRANQREYMLAHKAERREYDRSRKAKANEQRNARRRQETPERREHRLAQKRESYYRNRG